MIFTSPTPAVSIPHVSLTDYLLPRLAAHGAAHGDRAALIDGPSGRAINFPQL